MALRIEGYALIGDTHTAAHRREPFRASDDRLRLVEVTRDPRVALALGQHAELGRRDPHAVPGRALRDRYARMRGADQRLAAVGTAHADELLDVPAVGCVLDLAELLDELPIAPGAVDVLLTLLLVPPLLQERISHVIHGSPLAPTALVGKRGGLGDPRPGGGTHLPRRSVALRRRATVRTR